MEFAVHQGAGFDALRIQQRVGQLLAAQQGAAPPPWPPGTGTDRFRPRTPRLYEGADLLGDLVLVPRGPCRVVHLAFSRAPRASRMLSVVPARIWSATICRPKAISSSMPSARSSRPSPRGMHAHLEGHPLIWLFVLSIPGQHGRSWPPAAAGACAAATRAGASARPRVPARPRPAGTPASAASRGAPTRRERLGTASAACGDTLSPSTATPGMLPRAHHLP